MSLLYNYNYRTRQQIFFLFYQNPNCDYSYHDKLKVLFKKQGKTAHGRTFFNPTPLLLYIFLAIYHFTKQYLWLFTSFFSPSAASTGPKYTVWEADEKSQQKTKINQEFYYKRSKRSGCTKAGFGKKTSGT